MRSSAKEFRHLELTSFTEAYNTEKTSELPFVSIIVAAYNAEKTIGNCLKSLTSLDYPKYEIIVVDNNSTDNTANIVRAYDVVYLLEQERGWPAARNTGVRHSKAQVIANIDADCTADKHWLKNLVRELMSDDKIGGVVGRTYVEEGDTMVEKFYAKTDPFNIEKINYRVRITRQFNDLAV